MKKNKIALGTVQFGMNYGINNKRGKIPSHEVFEILTEALSSGIDTLDTASVYGNSEEVIGEFIKENKKDFKVVSKLPRCDFNEIEKAVDDSLKKLSIKKLYGYLVHNFTDYKGNPAIFNKLRTIKSDGKINKTGFSIYFPEELEYIYKKEKKVDIIQVPYNIFDRRFEKYFERLKKAGTEIHVRSIFLQGLFLKNPDKLDKHFVKAKEKIRNLNLLSKKINIPIIALCLNFAVFNRFIDKVIVGIDNIANLKEILDSIRYFADFKEISDKLQDFRERDENIILPMNWKV